MLFFLEPRRGDLFQNLREFFSSRTNSANTVASEECCSRRAIPHRFRWRRHHPGGSRTPNAVKGSRIFPEPMASSSSPTVPPGLVCITASGTPPVASTPGGPAVRFGSVRFGSFHQLADAFHRYTDVTMIIVLEIVLVDGRSCRFPASRGSLLSRFCALPFLKIFRTA